MTAETQTFDPGKVQAFAGKLVGFMNGGSLTIMCSIGHQVGLFDALAASGPTTSEGLGKASGLTERYVREWLGAMVCGDVVDYDPATQTYTLPAEHAACLTRASGPGNIAAGMQFLPMLAQVEGPIIESFRNGGGVPYSAFERFHRIMAEDSAAVHDRALLHGILPLAPGIPERLEAGIDVCDVGCGSGHAINLMAQAYPKSRFVGYDFSEEGIAAARKEAQEWGVANAQFEVRDVTVLGLTDRFDLITAFDAIHDQAHPAQVLAGISRALKPDGTFLMVDIRASSNLEDNTALPMGAAFYTMSTMHCMTVSLALGGDGLGTVWGEQLARTMLADAGFSQVEVTQVEHDFFNNYFIAKK